MAAWEHPRASALVPAREEGCGTRTVLREKTQESPWLRRNAELTLRSRLSVVDTC